MVFAEKFLKPNNPLLVAAVLLIIFIGFIFLLSLKVPAQISQVTDSNVLLPQAPLKDGFVFAPELAGISGYINTPQQRGTTIASLKGKVVLVDFWTYTCINCIRTIPYLNSWHEKYADKGLVIIGVHTPEFEFEKDTVNVRAAVEKYGIKYPVVQDNDYATWNAFGNHYWPHKFLIDSEGYIRYDHIGEGGYDETEQQIVELLKERDQSVQMGYAKVIPGETDFAKIGTPELYLGYQFARQGIGNSEGLKPEETVGYKLPNSFEPNVVYLEGQWKNNSDNVELVSETGRVALVFTAKNVNIVAGSSANASAVILELDGAPIPASSFGTDASMDSVRGGVAVSSQRLYNIVSLPAYAKEKKLIFTVNGKGFRFYTFTFG